MCWVKSRTNQVNVTTNPPQLGYTCESHAASESGSGSGYLGARVTAYCTIDRLLLSMQAECVVCVACVFRFHTSASRCIVVSLVFAHAWTLPIFVGCGDGDGAIALPIIIYLSIPRWLRVTVRHSSPRLRSKCHENGRWRVWKIAAVASAMYFWRCREHTRLLKALPSTHQVAEQSIFIR